MTTSTEAMRELRLQRLAAGLCQSCGERPPEPHRKACQPCLEDQAKRAQARRERLWPRCKVCNKKPALVKDVTIAGHTRRRLKVLPRRACYKSNGKRQPGGTGYLTPPDGSVLRPL